MFTHILKVSFRNFLRHKGYSFINVFGLAVGLVCCFFIVLFVRQELSYDNFHTKADRIYRVLIASTENPQDRSSRIGSGFAPDLTNEFPDIEMAVRVSTGYYFARVRQASKIHSISGLVLADASFLEVFDFPLLRGDPHTALAAPNSLVITAEEAKAWFGDVDPIGQTMGLVLGNQNLNVTVSGIMEQVPANSHLQFQYLLSFSTLKAIMGEDALKDYKNYNYYTYLLLHEGAPIERLVSKFGGFLNKRFGERAAQSTVLSLQPLSDIHLTTDIRWDVETNASKDTLYIFSVAALFILSLAIINFVNLATARGALRAKEVGVRKVVGAFRRQLVSQLFVESLLASLIATVLAVIIIELLTPSIGRLVGKTVETGSFSEPSALFMLLGIGLVTGLLAGIYPALVLSAFNPLSVLKGMVTRGKKGAALRKWLIVVQFVISVFFLLAMTTMFTQLDYMKNSNLGFNREQVILVFLSGSVKEHYGSFRSQLLTKPGIEDVALSTVPGRVGTRRRYKWPEAEEALQQGPSIYTMFVDPHSQKALGLELVAGRFFSDEIPTDTSLAYMLNETAVRELGWEHPVGHAFRAWDDQLGQVVGVVKDFHYNSLHQKIEPLVLDMKPKWVSTAAVRIATDDISGTLNFMEDQWKSLEQEFPFSYRFLDEDFDRLYRSEEQLGRLFTGFTALAVLVACLGLFGLAAFTIEQRTKEIGIRKVLGASATGVVGLLSRDFVVLVLIANVVAWPLAYIVMNRWLQDFAYRVEISWWMFALVGGTALLIALLTVSVQAVRAALANPVKALRYE